MVLLLKSHEWVANRIIQLCKQDNISINKLATLSGVAQSTISSILKGKSRNPQLLTIRKISNAVGISAAEFFKDFEEADIEDE